MLLAVSLFTACESPESTSDNGGTNDGIRFITAISRATGNQWEVNDSVGVFQVASGQDISNALAENVLYRTPDGDGTFSSNKPLFYPDGETTTYDFTAYYPYKKGITTTYPVDVSRQTNLNKLDLLYARTNGQNATNTTVNLQFRHCLSNLLVEIKAGKDVTSLEKLSVTLTGCPTKATFDLETGKFTTGENSVKDIPLNVKAGSDKLSATAEAIVIPASWTNCTLVFRQPSEGSFTYTFKDGEFLAGKKYKLVATLSKEGTIHGVELEGLDSSIDNWETEGGDMGAVDENFEGGSGTTEPSLQDGDGTKSKPYIVRQLLNFESLNITKDYYVTGYFTGVANTTSLESHFGPITQEEYAVFMNKVKLSNILLADTQDERDSEKLVLIRETHGTLESANIYLLPQIGNKITVKISAKEAHSGVDESWKAFCSGRWIFPAKIPLTEFK